MPKRMTDTDLWKRQRWFRKLSPEYKLAFCYIKDQCDHAGIWNIDCSDLIDDLGIENFDVKKFVKSVNIEFDKISGEPTVKERIRILDNGYLWVTGYFQFQYKGKEGLVNPYANPVISATQILRGYGLWEEAIDKGFITLKEGLIENDEKDIRSKDQYKDKDKDNFKKETEVKFKTNPVVTDFNGLPKDTADMSIQMIKTMQNVDIDIGQATSMWDVFKMQNLTGHKWYGKESDVYSHFLNWIKDKKFTNGKRETSSVGREIIRDKP